MRHLLLTTIAFGVVAVGALVALNRQDSTSVDTDAIAEASGLPADIAKHMGDYTRQYGTNVAPMLEYTEGARDIAAKVVSGAGLVDTQWVYVVVVSGDFVYTGGMMRSDSYPPTGKYLILTFATGSGMVLSTGVTNRPPDLAAIGSVYSVPIPPA